MIAWLEQTTVLHNPLQTWLIAAAVALVGFLVVHGILHSIANRLRARRARAPERSRGVLLALLEATSRWIIFVVAILLATEFLALPDAIAKQLGHTVFAVVALQIALWASALIHLWLRDRPDRVGQKSINPVLSGMLVWAFQCLVWTVLLLAFLSNVGVDVTAFVASLGIGGIAVALALQNVLGDLFASVSIGLDKPFEVGETISFDDITGTVTDVGIKTTRIASLSGEQLVISNSELLKKLVHNISRLTERRVVFGFSVPYGTVAARVKAVVTKTRELIEAEPKARFDRGHFIAFSESGLQLEFVYYVLDTRYAIYRDVQQSINLGIVGLLGEMDLEFAVPTMQLRGAFANISGGANTDAATDAS